MQLFYFQRRSIINKALAVMLTISGFFMFAYAMFTPIYALFVEQIGGGITTASNAYAVFWAVAGLLTFITGKFESKMKETELAIALSQYIVAASYLILYFTSSSVGLYMAMAVLGVGNAVFWPAFHSVYGRHTNKTNSTEQWAFYDGLAYLIPAVGAAVGGWLVKNYGFDLVFLIMAVVTFICGTFIFLLPRKVL